MANNRHLFMVGLDVRKAMSTEVVRGIADDLRAADLYRLPYPEVTIRTQADGLVRWVDKDGGENVGDLGPTAFVDFRMRESDPEFLRIVITDPVVNYETDVTDEALKLGLRDHDRRVGLAELRRQACDMLVVLLATRNAVKTTTEDKLAKLGIGSGKGKHRYRYTTTITLPAASEMEDDAEHPPTVGGTRLPHLRRGHLRNQRFGPGLQFVKRIFIEPVFVNADPSFVSTREAYNVSLGARS